MLEFLTTISNADSIYICCSESELQTTEESAVTIGLRGISFCVFGTPYPLLRDYVELTKSSFLFGKFGLTWTFL